jgi:acetyl esterase/lipase
MPETTVTLEALAAKRAELKGAERVRNAVGGGNGGGTLALELAQRARDHVAAELDELAVAAVKQSRRGSKVDALASEILRDDPTGKAERIAASLRGDA